MSAQVNPDKEGMTLAELVSSSLVLCPRCSQVFTSPVLLPCLHPVCQACVVDLAHIQQAGRGTNISLNCPICQSEVALGETDTKQREYTRPKSAKQSMKTVNSQKENNFDEVETPITESQSLEINNRKGNKFTSDDSQSKKYNETDEAKINKTAEQSQSTEAPVASKTANENTDSNNIAKERIEQVVQISLATNRFLASLSQLRRYKSEVDRQCQYCKSEGQRVEATSLCLQCADDVCDACAMAHRKTRVTRDHCVASYTSIRKGLYDHDLRECNHDTQCDLHPNNSLTYFCQDCYALACKTCRNQRHANHSTTGAREAFSKLVAEVKHIEQGIRRRVPTLTQYQHFLGTQLAKLEAAKVKAMSQLDDHVKAVLEKVQRHKEEMETRLQKEHSREVERLQTMVTNMVTAEKGHKTTAELLLQLHNNGMPTEVLQVYGPVWRRHQQMVTSEPDALTNLLTTHYTPGPATDQNIAILLGSLSLEHKPLGQDDSPQVRLPVTSLMPELLETSQLMQTFQCATHTDTRPPCPTGLAVHGNMLALLDRENKAVKLFELSGKSIREFRGKGEHQLVKPFGVTFLANGALVVSDPGARKVKVFDWMGGHITDIQGEMIQHPRAVTTNEAGQIVVLDGHLRQMSIHDPQSGDLIRVVRPLISDPDLPPDDVRHRELLIDPHYVACTPQGRLVVTDVASPNLKIVEGHSGTVLATELDYGTRQGETLHPSGVCVDQFGQILVVDTLNSRVLLCLPDGTMMTALKYQGVTQPMAVAIDPTTGHLIVAQAGGEVSVLKYI